MNSADFHEGYPCNPKRNKNIAKVQYEPYNVVHLAFTAEYTPGFVLSQTSQDHILSFPPVVWM